MSHEDEKTGRWSIYCSELNGDNLVTAGDWPGEPIAMEVTESCTANESSDWIRASRDVVGMAAFGL